MNCDLENSFLLAYLPGLLIKIHVPRGATPADPPFSVGLSRVVKGNIMLKYWVKMNVACVLSFVRKSV